MHSTQKGRKYQAYSNSAWCHATATSQWLSSQSNPCMPVSSMSTPRTDSCYAVLKYSPLPGSGHTGPRTREGNRDRVIPDQVSSTSVREHCLLYARIRTFPDSDGCVYIVTNRRKSMQGIRRFPRCAGLRHRSSAESTWFCADARTPCSGQVGLRALGSSARQCQC